MSLCLNSAAFGLNFEWPNIIIWGVMSCSSVDTHQCFCETCCLHLQDMRTLRQQVPIKWLYLSTGPNRVTIYMPVHIASLSSLHCKFWCKSQICVLQFLFHKSECMCTHTCRNAHTLFPNYTQKQISFSHKWYILKIKKESTYSSRVHIWTCDVLFVYLICHQL